MSSILIEVTEPESDMAKRELEGRVTLVTGGGSGQGRAIALALAAKGADIAFGSFVAGEGDMAPWEETTYPTRQEMAEAASAIEQHGTSAHGQHLDLRSNESCQDMIEQARNRFGKIDILANVAGICAQLALPGHDDEAWDKVIDINLSGTWRMIRRCLGPMMERGWGRIIVISSTAANVGAANYSAYCASKAGLLGLMRCAAIEGAPHGVTCNAINPGFVNTGMVKINLQRLARIRGMTKEGAYAEAASGSPMNRILQPDEIAGIAAFLCTDAASGITLEDITVSGGRLW